MPAIDLIELIRHLLLCMRAFRISIMGKPNGITDPHKHGLQCCQQDGQMALLLLLV